ncbi:Polynucleotidyl transferase, Ribonuclease H fold [Gossypium australe]|uniref:Polynucleotidyl transferase, Ribonuclease H fold n=1 Tax=Gossypium australe TaxID=47621 RepID=A0A5B6W6S0_9ROSI|nr:Polynucleotidyl transferase, Ribonuclease H fold [Gossypium australe]
MPRVIELIWFETLFGSMSWLQGNDVDSNDREIITNILGVRVASNPEKYLGLPMMVRKKKTWAFANFVDRFRKRIDGFQWWERRFSLNRFYKLYQYMLCNAFLCRKLYVAS